MLAEIKVGIRQFIKNAGAVHEARSEPSGALIVADGHGRYQEAVLQGNVYIGAAQGALSFPAGLAPTAPVYTLYNPAGSGKNLVLLAAQFVPTAAPATPTVAAIALSPVAAAPTGTTPIVVRPALLSAGPPGVGAVYSAATIAAGAVVVRPLPIAFTTAAVIFPAADIPLDGSLILTPGFSISIVTLIAVTALAGLIWEEVPA